jgi:hypothetical protein
MTQAPLASGPADLPWRKHHASHPARQRGRRTDSARSAAPALTDFGPRWSPGWPAKLSSPSRRCPLRLRPAVSARQTFRSLNAAENRPSWRGSLFRPRMFTLLAQSPLASSVDLSRHGPSIFARAVSSPPALNFPESGPQTQLDRIPPPPLYPGLPKQAPRPLSGTRRSSSVG